MVTQELFSDLLWNYYGNCSKFNFYLNNFCAFITRPTTRMNRVRHSFELRRNLEEFYALTFDFIRQQFWIFLVKVIASQLIRRRIRYSAVFETFVMMLRKVSSIATEAQYRAWKEFPFWFQQLVLLINMCNLPIPWGRKS